MSYVNQVSSSYVSAHDRRVKEMFREYDTDKDGILTFADFMEYNLRSTRGLY